MSVDFLAIGDIAVDNFIRLSDAEIVQSGSGGSKLCVNYKEKIPYESFEEIPGTGNAANATVAAVRLGLKSSLLTYIGNDENGQKCMVELQRNSVGVENVRIENGKHTNCHFVLWYDADRTILVKHELFSYSLEDVDEPKWIYLSSLSENSIPFHGQIVDYLGSHPNVKLAVQPGTFQLSMHGETLDRLYKRTEVFVVNVEEAQQILNTKSRDVPTLVTKLAELGPRNVFITDGLAGAYGFDGQSIYHIPAYPHKPYERTGAGDAFAATITSCFILGKSFEEAMLWAPVNAMSVTQYIGSQKGLLQREAIERYLASAPVEYKVDKI
jgi:sugar/nucleoside kinase (ribokinase family)